MNLAKQHLEPLEQELYLSLLMSRQANKAGQCIQQWGSAFSKGKERQCKTDKERARNSAEAGQVKVVKHSSAYTVADKTSK